MGDKGIDLIIHICGDDALHLLGLHLLLQCGGNHALHLLALHLSLGVGGNQSLNIIGAHLRINGGSHGCLLLGTDLTGFHSGVIRFLAQAGGSGDNLGSNLGADGLGDLCGDLLLHGGSDLGRNLLPDGFGDLVGNHGQIFIDGTGNGFQRLLVNGILAEGIQHLGQHLAVVFNGQVGHLHAGGLQLGGGSCQQGIEHLLGTAVQGVVVGNQRAQAGGQGCCAVTELTCAVQQGSGAVFQCNRAVQQLLYAVLQLAGFVPQGVQTVIQRTGTVGQLGQAIGQLVDGTAQVIGGGQLAVLQCLKHLVGHQGQGLCHLEVGGIGSEFQVRGDGHLVVLQPQGFLHSRESKPHNGGALAVIDQLAAGDFHVAEVLVVQHNTGDGSKGNINLLNCAVDFPLLILGVLIVKADGHAATLACQLLRGNLLAIQQETHAEGDGQRLVGGAPVVDVISRSIPDAGSV